ncbi:hypothetical protein EDB89DRAFT_1907908 [Lactarius sanguifluus]|nr:hypothetical protein EDB89DRAFT_1907908 [Lactarius sanguifluus]
MAVAGVVAALAGFWWRPVVFVQLKAVVVIVVVGRLRCMWLGLVGDSSAMYENGNHRAGVEKVATGHGGFPRSTTTTTNSPAYVLSQTQQRRPVMAIPTVTTTQRITPAMMTMTRRRWFNNGERRHDSKAAKASSNDDDTIDGGRGAAITRQATAVIRMRWRGVVYPCDSNEYEYSQVRVLAAQTGTRGTSMSVSPENSRVRKMKVFREKRRPIDGDEVGTSNNAIEMNYRQTAMITLEFRTYNPHTSVVVWFVPNWNKPVYKGT